MDTKKLTDKEELVNLLSKKLDTTKTNALTILNSFTDVLVDMLIKNKKVRLDKVGIFEIIRTKSRIATNPRDITKQVQVPEKNRATFKASKTLKDEINS